MDKAAKKGDPSKTPIDIETWSIANKNDTPVCLNCGDEVIPKAINSPTVSAHFAHLPGASCPVVQRSSFFAGIPRGNSWDPEVVKLKQDILDNIDAIYATAAKQCGRLTWNDFISAIESATKLNVWTLKHIELTFVPYVILCCVDRFAADPPFRPDPVFFVLEARASQQGYWNAANNVKKFVWRVREKTTPKGQILALEKVEMGPALLDPWYLPKVREALGK